jgi:protein O-mannosyl-transferase
MSGTRERAAISIGLCLLVAAGYSGVAGLGFVAYDDDQYVALNPIVNGGLRPVAVLHAFTRFWSDNWHPLTWISHMVDVSLFGLTPGGPHVVNALLHAASAVLAFLALAKLTGTTWRAAFAAALFAIHPLRVESVAWIAERKDVLSAFFALAALWVWPGWVREGRARSYWGAVALCAASLMAKPTLVTFPFLLLLLDFWPLRRLDSAAALWPLAREKTPFFTLAAASCAVTLFAQTKAMQPAPLLLRLENADLAYAEYLRRFFLPTDLAVMYPFRESPDTLLAVACALGLLALTAVAFVQARRRPWLLVGWLWFIGLLVPMLGIVRVGAQAFADRYTYLPSVGLSLVVAFACGEVVQRVPTARAALVAAAALALAACTILTRAQVPTWHDTVSLFRHATEVTPSNWYAYTELGVAQVAQGDLGAAQESLETALRIRPDTARALVGLGQVQSLRGDTATGIANLQRALELEPTVEGGQLGLAVSDERAGRLEEAEAAYRRALDDPQSSGVARLRLARLLSIAPDPKLRDGAQALALLDDACRAQPCDTPEILDIRAMALMEAGHQEEAIATVQHAIAAADAQGDSALAATLANRMVGYQSGHPARLRSVVTDR